MYRVRWWRPGWKAAESNANARYFVQRSAAEHFMAKLGEAPANDAGLIHVELAWCSRGPWSVLDRLADDEVQVW